MNYNDLVQSVNNLDFVRDEQMADAIIKATLGIVASNMSEADAREFTRPLPEPLTVDKLRSHQENPNNVSPDEHIQQICNQFGLDERQAEEVVQNVFSLTKRNLPENQAGDWLNRLDNEWTSFVQRFG